MTKSAPITTVQRKAVMEKLERRLRNQVEEINSRRGSQRLPFNAPVTVIRQNAQQETPLVDKAWGMDFSATGLGLLTEWPCLFNDEVEIDFGAALDQPGRHRLKIAYCINLVGSIYRIGGYFQT